MPCIILPQAFHSFFRISIFFPGKSLLKLRSSGRAVSAAVAFSAAVTEEGEETSFTFGVDAVYDGEETVVTVTAPAVAARSPGMTK